MFFSVEMLDFIGLFVQCSLVGLLLANLLVVRRMNSLLLAILSFLILQSVGITIKMPLRTWISDFNVHLARFLFYFVLGFVGILMVLFLSRMHRAAQLSVGTAARITAIWLVVYSAIQVIRFLDRYTIDLLAGFYVHYVPIANVTLVLVLCWYSIKEVRAAPSFFGIKGA